MGAPGLHAGVPSDADVAAAVSILATLEAARYAAAAARAVEANTAGPTARADQPHSVTAAAAELTEAGGSRIRGRRRRSWKSPTGCRRRRRRSRCHPDCTEDSPDHRRCACVCSCSSSCACACCAGGYRLTRSSGRSAAAAASPMVVSALPSGRAARRATMRRRNLRPRAGAGQRIEDGRVHGTSPRSEWTADRGTGRRLRQPHHASPGAGRPSVHLPICRGRRYSCAASPQRVGHAPAPRPSSPPTSYAMNNPGRGRILPVRRARGACGGACWWP